MFKLGILADWFGGSLQENLQEARRMGADGVQLYTWKELDIASRSTQSIAGVVRQALERFSLELSALCVDSWPLASQGSDAFVDYFKNAFDLAQKLDCAVVASHIPPIPREKTSVEYKKWHGICSRIGRHAQGSGAVFAIETGSDRVSELVEFIDSCEEGIGINFDPANIAMISGDDPAEGVRIAGKRIVHTHVKDGINLTPVDPNAYYSRVLEKTITVEEKAKIWASALIGEGDVDWVSYLTALYEQDYRGYLTIERESAQAKVEIKQAISFLKELELPFPLFSRE